MEEQTLFNMKLLPHLFGSRIFNGAHNNIVRRARISKIIAPLGICFGGKGSPFFCVPGNDPVDPDTAFMEIPGKKRSNVSAADDCN
jgi:hypothetical protein